MQARLVAVDGAAKRLLLDADAGELRLGGKLRSGDLDLARLAPSEPGVSGPFEVAAAALGLLHSHRIPLGLRHRDLDRDHVVERIKGIECLLLLISHVISPVHRGLPTACGATSRYTRVPRYLFSLIVIALIGATLQMQGQR